MSRTIHAAPKHSYVEEQLLVELIQRIVDELELDVTFSMERGGEDLELVALEFTGPDVGILKADGDELLEALREIGLGVSRHGMIVAMKAADI